MDFKHRAWSIERGAPSRINSITQGPDGFLLIGSVEGLFRFDGVRFEAVEMSPPTSRRLVVSNLHAARSGDVWVGLARGGGVAVLRDGRLVDARMPNPSREVNDIEEGSDGAIWVARGGRSTLMLARFQAGAWQEFGPDSGLPAEPAWQLHTERDGTLWVVLSHALAYLRPGETRFRLARQTVTPRASPSEDPQGRLWISDATGTRRLRPLSEGGPVFPHPGRVGGTRLMFDRQGDLWTTTLNSGVQRIRAPGPASATDRLAILDAAGGLTSDQTRALFQDREGSLWVGTELGLDQLRPASVVVEPALPRNSATSYRMAAARDGTVYVADAQALYAILPGQPPKRALANRTPAEALCAAGDGGVWLILADRVLRVDASGRVWRHAKPAGTTAYGCVEDASGRLWMPALERGLHWLEDASWHRWAEPEPSPSLPANAALEIDGRAAVLFRGRPPQGELPFRGLDARTSAVGGIEGLLPTASGLLLSGGDGLARADTAAAARPLSGEAAPWAASINGLAQTPQGDTWTIGDAGIVRLRTSDLEFALREPGRAPAHRVFGFLDGLNSFVQKAPGAQVAVGGDGRVWFLTRRNVLRVDPAALQANSLPPPVLVRAVHAGDQSFPATPRLSLPAGTTTARVEFTALSLAVPERVRFRHRLLGANETWSPPSPERSALLTDLRPGDYRFELRASNDDGVWSDTPIDMTITIPATFTQTAGFKAGIAAALVLLAYGLSVLRMRQVLARVRERDEERSGERERIARDMHDTLLQSLQGLILHFQAVAHRLRGDPQARRELDQVLDHANAALCEGRDRLQGLRRVSTGELEDAVRQLVQRQPFDPGTRVAIASDGPNRRLRPDVFDEVLPIVGEALFNAARHAGATEVNVRLEYGARWLRIEVRDNGVGLNVEKLARARGAGHFGMQGMHERAQRIDARLDVVADGASGTSIVLRVKAGIAYEMRDAQPAAAPAWSPTDTAHSV